MIITRLAQKVTKGAQVAMQRVQSTLTTLRNQMPQIQLDLDVGETSSDCDESSSSMPAESD